MKLPFPKECCSVKVSVIVSLIRQTGLLCGPLYYILIANFTFGFHIVNVDDLY